MYIWVGYAYQHTSGLSVYTRQRNDRKKRLFLVRIYVVNDLNTYILWCETRIHDSDRVLSDFCCCRLSRRCQQNDLFIYFCCCWVLHFFFLVTSRCFSSISLRSIKSLNSNAVPCRFVEEQYGWQDVKRVSSTLCTHTNIFFLFSQQRRRKNRCQAYVENERFHISWCANIIHFYGNVMLQMGPKR